MQYACRSTTAIGNPGPGPENTIFTEAELQIANPVNTGTHISQLRLIREKRYPWLSPPTLSFLKRLACMATVPFLRRTRSDSIPSYILAMDLMTGRKGRFYSYVKKLMGFRANSKLDQSDSVKTTYGGPWGVYAAGAIFT
jgi:hypothetical protein